MMSRQQYTIVATVYLYCGPSLPVSVTVKIQSLDTLRWCSYSSSTNTRCLPAGTQTVIVLELVLELVLVLKLVLVLVLVFALSH